MSLLDAYYNQHIQDEQQQQQYKPIKTINMHKIRERKKNLVLRDNQGHLSYVFSPGHVLSSI